MSPERPRRPRERADTLSHRVDRPSPAISEEDSEHSPPPWGWSGCAPPLVRALQREGLGTRNGRFRNALSLQVKPFRCVSQVGPFGTQLVRSIWGRGIEACSIEWHEWRAGSQLGPRQAVFRLNLNGEYMRPVAIPAPASSAPSSPRPCQSPRRRHRSTLRRSSGEADPAVTDHPGEVSLLSPGYRARTLPNACTIHEMHSTTNEASFSDVDSVTESLLTASRALVAVAARSLAAIDESATLPQFRALVVLASRGPQLMGELADALSVHQSTATRLCDRLVVKGLIDRGNSSNRREVKISLTSDGQRLVNDVSAVRRAEIEQIVSRIPVAMRASTVIGLNAFSDAAGEIPQPLWALGWQ